MASAEQVKVLREIVEAVKADSNFLHDDELGFFRDWLTELGAQIPAKYEPEPMQMDEDVKPEEPALEEDELDRAVMKPEPPFEHVMGDPAKDVSEEDMEAAGAAKMNAQQLMSEGRISEAVEEFSKAVVLNPKSGLNWSARAACFLKMDRPAAAIKDAVEALQINPNSARGFRIRGQAYALLGKWEPAYHDICHAQQLDYDDGVVTLQKQLQKKVQVFQDKARKEKQREEQQKKQEEAGTPQEPGSAPPHGMPEMPGGMPGMPGGLPKEMMDKIMKDPEIMKLLMDPEVMQAATALSRDPSKIAQYQNNPKVMNFFQKVQGLMK